MPWFGLQKRRALTVTVTGWRCSGQTQSCSATLGQMLALVESSARPGCLCAGGDTGLFQEIQLLILTTLTRIVPGHWGRLDDKETGLTHWAITFCHLMMLPYAAGDASGLTHRATAVSCCTNDNPDKISIVAADTLSARCFHFYPYWLASETLARGG